MAKRITVFYAFPGNPPSLGETINRAIQELKGLPPIRNANVRFRPWPEMGIAGKQLIRTILENIDRADVFACDLTYPNPNVTFELGYAIGRFKRIWLSLNTGIDNAIRDYRRLYFGLLGLGYAEYQNHQDLANAFLNNSPVVDLNQTLLGEIYRTPTARQEYPTLLYVKPPVETDAVIATEEILRESIFGNSLLLDDPRENPSPTLEWYAGKLRTADAVVVHLLSSHHNGFLDHNVKCSLVAGLAHGFRNSMLMLAHTPFETPIDYEHLLKSHETAQECKKLIQGWIEHLEPSLPRRRARRPQEADVTAPTLDLRRLAIGEPVAENERYQLDEYFVETSTYYRAMDDPTTIVVGRRGTGKTAQLYAMYEALIRDKRHYVCVVKPVGYEIDGLVRVLQEIIHRSERGYLIESLWKFLIYTELARSVYESISAQPKHQAPSEGEAKFLDYFNNNLAILAPPFSERLDAAVRSLVGLGDLPEANLQRTRISERLHSQQLRDLREFLGLVLTRHEKVAILIDNLDGPWRPGQHIEQLSELLWGLLEVVDDIAVEFRRQDHWRKPVNVHLTVFLRSDIFAFVQPLAAEQDKLPIQRITWDDPEVLLRVLNQRLEFAVPKRFDAPSIWNQSFPSEVVGVPTWEFIIRTVLPRPRDIIYIVREAIDGAINRGHQNVTEQDLLDAREKYSEYIFRSILAEDDPRTGKLEAILYEFAGCTRTVTRSEVEERISQAEVAPSDIEFYIDILCDVGFLGIETSDGYRYVRHEAERQTMRQVARRLAIRSGKGEESFRVNAAFYQVLQVE